MVSERAEPGQITLYLKESNVNFSMPQFSSCKMGGLCYLSHLPQWFGNYSELEDEVVFLKTVKSISFRYMGKIWGKPLRAILSPSTQACCQRGPQASFADFAVSCRNREVCVAVESRLLPKVPLLSRKVWCKHCLHLL